MNLFPLLPNFKVSKIKGWKVCHSVLKFHFIFLSLLVYIVILKKIMSKASFSWWQSTSQVGNRNRSKHSFPSHGCALVTYLSPTKLYPLATLQHLNSDTGQSQIFYTYCLEEFLNLNEKKSICRCVNIYDQVNSEVDSTP